MSLVVFLHMAFSLLAKKDKRVPARGNWVMIINENEQINKKLSDELQKLSNKKETQISTFCEQRHVF